VLSVIIWLLYIGPSLYWAGDHLWVGKPFPYVAKIVIHLQTIT